MRCSYIDTETRIRFLVLLWFVIGIASIAFSQHTGPFAEIPYASDKITVDGDLSEWNTYFEYAFTDTLSGFVSFNHSGNLDEVFPENLDFGELPLPESRNKVVFRAFWNGNSFNAAFLVWDRHLFAEVPSRIDKPRIHLNDGVELYLDTKNEQSPKMDVNDYQFLIDIRNEKEIFKGDLREMLADTVAVPKDYAQNILLFSAVKILGTLNDGQPDSMYVIELSVPFAAIGVVPETGMVMGMDVCVNDIDYPASQARLIDDVSTVMWPFSWGGYSDFGYPMYWKEVKFIGGPGWVERVSEKYSSNWFTVYLITILISALLIAFLIFRVVKLRRMPQAHEIDEKRFMSQHPQKELSYNEKMLQKAHRYILENASETIHSEDLAKNIGVSLRTLQRITQKELKVTPTNYITVVKLNLAAEFLKNRAGNISDAAFRFGFSDPSYFSRQFKKHFGIAPSDFLKKHTL